MYKAKLNIDGEKKRKSSSSGKNCLKRKNDLIQFLQCSNSSSSSTGDKVWKRNKHKQKHDRKRSKKKNLFVQIYAEKRNKFPAEFFA